MSTISERVQRGAEWLDTERPGWFGEIDLSLLDLAECCLCVIGQVFGCYATERNPFDINRAVAVEHGFNAGIDSSNWYAENRELQAEWVRVITERRAAA